MNENNPFQFLGHLIAAAILLPLGWWVKVTYAPALADYLRSIF
ncbi:hypothetical protein [Brucella sp. 22210]